MNLGMVMVGEVKKRMRTIRVQKWQQKMYQNVRAAIRELLSLCALDVGTSGTAVVTVRWVLLADEGF
jgi:hypothetical protein